MVWGFLFFHRLFRNVKEFCSHSGLCEVLGCLSRSLSGPVFLSHGGSDPPCAVDASAASASCCVPLG